ncbi:MAG: hypothetical protein ACXVBK_15715, partial [Flavisolibacter sp.]
ETEQKTSNVEMNQTLRDTVNMKFNKLIIILDSVKDKHPDLSLKIDEKKKLDSLTNVIEGIQASNAAHDRNTLKPIKDALERLTKEFLTTEAYTSIRRPTTDRKEYAEKILRDEESKEVLEAPSDVKGHSLSIMYNVDMNPQELNLIQRDSLFNHLTVLANAPDWKTTYASNKNGYIDAKTALGNFIFKSKHQDAEFDVTATLNFAKKLITLNNNKTSNGTSTLAFEMSKAQLLDILRSSNDYSAITKNLSATSLFYLLGDGTVDIDTLEVNTFTNADKTNITYSTIPGLSELQPSDFNNFYIIDYFDSPCSHGQKVYDVVKQVLKMNSVDESVLEKVRLIPINYFQNQAWGDSVMAKWCKNYRDETLCTGDMVSRELKQKFQNNRKKSLELYLLCAYKLCADSMPFIISTSARFSSSSFFIQADLNSSNEVTNYVAASSDDDKTFAEDYTKPYKSGNGVLNRFYEPLGSYIITKKDYGVIVVGEKTGPGQYQGMSSKNGSVDVLGHGNNWGMKNCTNCIQPDDFGTSFATPEISTLLFIAKAVWKKNNKKIDPIEARTRLMLSADVEPAFVGHFASGGTPNLRKLIQLSNAFFVSKDDSIVTTDSVITTSIEKIKPEGQNEFTYEFKLSNGPRYIRGIYIDGDKTYVFSNSENAWKEIARPDKVDITTSNNGVEKTIRLEQFLKQYKEFILFE